MGYIDTSEKLPLFYNLFSAVGENCPNRRDDVMLVQYLLYWRYKNSKPYFAAPEGEINIDGIYDEITNNWILKFQSDIMLSGYPIQADNCVDRILDKETFRGLSADTIYTLALLNWIVSCEEPEAFAKTPAFVPLQNLPDSPRRQGDFIISKLPQMIPATGRI